MAANTSNVLKSRSERVRLRATLPLVMCGLFASFAPAQTNWREISAEVGPRIVKVYGAGGSGGLENYQTGFFISAAGRVLSVNSPVLDTDEVTLVTEDGTRLSARVVRTDPLWGLALLQAELSGGSVPCFELTIEFPRPEPGDDIFAVSNLFNVATGADALSVQRGVVAGEAPLELVSPFDPTVKQKQTVLLVDIVTSNPGAAGGVIVDARGQLLGMVGPERRSNVTGAWHNYALPANVLMEALARLEQPAPTQPITDQSQRSDVAELARRWGLWLAPEISPRTPAYVDDIVSGSPAESAGLQPDDLVVFVAETSTASVAEALAALSSVPQAERLPLVVERNGELVRINLTPPKLE
jgi:S1-C subfamily serine protease